MYKHVKAVLLGTIGTSIGVVHFDPDRDDEDGRYQRAVLPVADALKAENRKLVKIVGDATEDEFKAQQQGLSIPRVSSETLEALAEQSQNEDASASLAGGAAPATASVRNYQPGHGPAATSGDVDAAPLPGTNPSKGDGTSALLQLPIAKLKVALDAITDIAELDKLHAEESAVATPRAGALEAIDARKTALASSS